MTEADQDEAREEANILNHLSHPNVIRLLDKFETDDQIILVMPLMKMTLLKYLKECP